MFDCGHKPPFLGGQRDKFVRYKMHQYFLLSRYNNILLFYFLFLYLM